MRFNVRKMLIATALLSVVFAGLASPNSWWAAGAITALALWCMAALALAIGSQGRQRVFWSVALLVAVLYPISATPYNYSSNSGVLSAFQARFEDQLTTNILAAAHLALHNQPQPSTPVPASPVPASPVPVVSGYYSPLTAVPAPPVFTSPYSPGPLVDLTYAHFATVGKCFFALLYSALGGWLAAWAYSRRSTDPQALAAS